MYQLVSHVSACVTCISLCHMYQLVSHVSVCVTCISLCHMYQLVSHVSACVTCISLCHMYQLVSHVSACVTCISLLQHSHVILCDIISLCRLYQRQVWGLTLMGWRLTHVCPHWWSTCGGRPVGSWRMCWLFLWPASRGSS